MTETLQHPMQPPQVGIQDAPFRLLLLMRTFELSLQDVAHGSGGGISKTQLHRILSGKRPSPSERAAIAAAVVACLRSRCQDSAFLFED